jgi:hypothetical protein
LGFPVEAEGRPRDSVARADPFRADRQFKFMVPGCNEVGDDLGDLVPPDTADSTTE